MNKIKCAIVAASITICLIALYSMPMVEANGMPVKQEVKETKVVEKVVYEPIRPVEVMPAITPVPIIFEKVERSSNGENITGEEHNGVGAIDRGVEYDIDGSDSGDTETDETEERFDKPEDESEGIIEYPVYGESIEGPESEPEPEEYVEPEPEPEEYVEPEPESNLEYVGEWTITAYCSCVECCGSWGNATASGVTPCSGHTVACNILPMGTQVMIDGIIYIVEDTGWTPYGDAWIDIYFDTHEEALAYGLHTTSVYIVH